MIETCMQANRESQLRVTGCFPLSVPRLPTAAQAGVVA